MDTHWNEKKIIYVLYSAYTVYDTSHVQINIFLWMTNFISTVSMQKIYMAVQWMKIFSVWLEFYDITDWTIFNISFLSCTPLLTAFHQRTTSKLKTVGAIIYCCATTKYFQKKFLKKLFLFFFSLVVLMIS